MSRKAPLKFSRREMVAGLGAASAAALVPSGAVCKAGAIR